MQQLSKDVRTAAAMEMPRFIDITNSIYSVIKSRVVIWLVKPISVARNNNQIMAWGVGSNLKSSQSVKIALIYNSI